MCLFTVIKLQNWNCPGGSRTTGCSKGATCTSFPWCVGLWPGACCTMGGTEKGCYEAPATKLECFHIWCINSSFADLAVITDDGTDQVRMFLWCFRITKYFPLQNFMGPTKLAVYHSHFINKEVRIQRSYYNLPEAHCECAKLRLKPKCNALASCSCSWTSESPSNVYWVCIYCGWQAGALGSACSSWWLAFPSRWPTSTNEKPETDNWDAWAAQPSLTVPSAGQLRQRSAFTPATATGSSPSPVLGQVNAVTGSVKT